MSLVDENTVAPARSRGRWFTRAAATIAVTALALGGGALSANAATWSTALVSGGPSLSVTASGSSVDVSDSITITGSGFTENTQGLYVSFGSVDESGWRPSAGADGSHRKTNQTVWINDNAPAGSTDQAQWGSTTGTFTATIVLDEPYDAYDSTNFHVFAINGHGVAVAGNEQAVRVPYVGSTNNAGAPSGTAGHIDNVVRSGTNFVVTGSGYTSAPATGIYVSIGTLADSGWKPSTGAASSTRAASDTVWTWSAGPLTQSGGIARLSSTGTFSVTVSGSSLPSTAGTGRHFAAYTIGAHGSVSAASESEWAVTP